MKQSLIKLVDVILRRIEEQPETGRTEQGLRSWLARQGYNKRDIDAAMKLVRPHMAPRQDLPAPPSTVRTFSPAEEQKLTTEARNALARLDVYGLIDSYERELILDRLGQFEGEVGIEELDYLVSWLVCSTRDYESQQYLYNVLEGDTGTFH